MEKVETIIGLEVHVQLATKTKLFCPCKTSFGQPPNTLTCPVCIGLPGALPVLNQEALRLAIATGTALDCCIADQTHWDRKNYFYPDLPKGYQISQLDAPICGPGHLDIIHDSDSPAQRVRIERAHLEEDAGKSTHDSKNGLTLVDLNRAGTPLLEIVTKPDLRSGNEAKTFLLELKLILGYIGVSDCNMQQGSLRVDANVNLHVKTPEGLIATPIVEIKNLNSFRGVERAIEFESQRQWEQWQKTSETIDDAPKQTRGWDDQNQETILQRAKELAADYRYFPEPDLQALTIPHQWIENARASLPVLPQTIRSELQNDWKLGEYDARVIVNQGPATVDYFRAVAQRVQDGKMAANWTTQEILRWVGESGKTIDQHPVTPERLADLLTMVQKKKIDVSRAKSVLESMIHQKTTAAQAIEQLGIKVIAESELNQICEDLLVQSPEVAKEYLAGNVKAIGALIGAAKKRNPNVNPGLVRQLLIKLIEQQRP